MRKIYQYSFYRRARGIRLFIPVIFERIIQFVDYTTLRNLKETTIIFKRNTILSGLVRRYSSVLIMEVNIFPSINNKGHVSTEKKIWIWKKKAFKYKIKFEKEIDYTKLKSIRSPDSELILMDCERTLKSSTQRKITNPQYFSIILLYRLYRILQALANAFKSIGYCQGLSFIAATIFNIVSEEDVIYDRENIDDILDNGICV